MAKSKGDKPKPQPKGKPSGGKKVAHGGKAGP